MIKISKILLYIRQIIFCHMHGRNWVKWGKSNGINMKFLISDIWQKKKNNNTLIDTHTVAQFMPF